MNFVINMHTDLLALLEGTAVRVLPAELVKALRELDQSRRADEVITNPCATAWQQYTVPLRLRRTPITGEERRGLEYVQELFRSRLGYTKERLKLGTQAPNLLDKYTWGR